MYCPCCGQDQASEITRFCSRCGFLLTGIGEVIANNGLIPHDRPKGSQFSSPRWKGIKQGIFIFALTLLVIPLLAILTIAMRVEPFAVVAAAILLTVGGILRVIYALLFQSNEPADVIPSQNQGALSGAAERGMLPPPVSTPVSAYTAPKPASWRDTKDLVEPSSVTERTTSLLTHESDQ